MAGLAVMRRAGVEADVPWLWGQGSLAVAVKKNTRNEVGTGCGGEVTALVTSPIERYSSSSGFSACDFNFLLRCLLEGS